MPESAAGPLRQSHPHLQQQHILHTLHQHSLSMKRPLSVSTRREQPLQDLDPIEYQLYPRPTLLVMLLPCTTLPSPTTLPAYPSNAPAVIATPTPTISHKAQTSCTQYIDPPALRRPRHALCQATWRCRDTSITSHTALHPTPTHRPAVGPHRGVKPLLLLRGVAAAVARPAGKGGVAALDNPV